jgi:hypothetical protein
MIRNMGSRALAAVMLAVAAVATAGTLPAQAQAQGPAGKLGNEFIYTYYANAAHTGAPVGGFIYGYCPSYFSNSWGTRTPYFVSSEEPC